MKRAFSYRNVVTIKILSFSVAVIFSSFEIQIFFLFFTRSALRSRNLWHTPAICVCNTPKDEQQKNLLLSRGSNERIPPYS